MKRHPYDLKTHFVRNQSQRTARCGVKLYWHPIAWHWKHVTCGNCLRMRGKPVRFVPSAKDIVDDSKIIHFSTAKSGKTVTLSRFDAKELTRGIHYGRGAEDLRG